MAAFKSQIRLLFAGPRKVKASRRARSGCTILASDWAVWQPLKNIKAGLLRKSLSISPPQSGPAVGEILLLPQPLNGLVFSHKQMSRFIKKQQ